MALYVPEDGVPPRAVFEDLARSVLEQYALAERRIVAQIARRLERDLTAEGPLARLQAQLEGVQYVEAQARAALAKIDHDLAGQAMTAAEEAGAASAVARLGLAVALPTRGPITTGRTRALSLLQLDLSNRLEDASQRILRSAADAYQQLAADTVSPVLLGTQGKLEAQRAGIARFLGDGLPAFVDEGGRQWSTGAYVEMVTRTATQRAYTESAVTRMQDAGINLVTIVVGVGSCRMCAQWIGRVLSTDGTTGPVIVQHATNGADITVDVTGTLAGARAAGWGHPNCRCHVAAYLPGLPIPAAATTYDPVLEAAHARQRELERRLRRDKLRLSVNADDTTKARIRATQDELRQHIATHDLPRKRNREQPAFSG